MPTSFWIKRIITVVTGFFLLLFVVYLVRGRTPSTAATESALWAAISTSLFIATRLYRSRQGQHCELCGDTPEAADKNECTVPKSIFQ